jgi:hypothetical protein
MKPLAKSLAHLDEFMQNIAKNKADIVENEPPIDNSVLSS